MTKTQQYQPTPELQKVLDQLAPSILQQIKLANQSLKLKCYSRDEKDPNIFIFFVEAEMSGKNKLFKI